MTIRIPSLMPPAESSATDPSAADHDAMEQNAPLTTPFAHETVGLDGDASLLKGRFSGVLVLLFVLCIAGGTLFGMRSLGRAGRIALLDIKIDYPLDSASVAANLKDQQLVLQDLRSSGHLKQVPLEEVQMNPFEWRSLGPTKSASSSKSALSPEEIARREREARVQEINRAFSALRLNSIIGGRIPVARISGELVRAGGQVGEYFVVKSISGRGVTLIADDLEFELSLGR